MARVEVDVRVLVQHIIDAVGDQFPLAGGAKIVVKGFHRLGGEGRARTMKIPQEFLLFRVNRNHRITSRLVLAPQTRNVLKLRVAVGMVAHGLFLPRRAATSMQLPQQPSDGATTCRGAHRYQSSR
jgi:hypothetical protein